MVVGKLLRAAGRKIWQDRSGQGPKGHKTKQHRRLAPGLTLSSTLLAALSLCLSAHAQTPPRSAVVPQGSPLERAVPPSAPAASPSVLPSLLPPPGSEVPDRPVNVTSASVEGVTAFPQADIDRYADGLIGPAMPLPKIDAARQAILQRYRARGFVLTTVSVKLDGAGKLRFIVVEGRIASVKLDGDIGPAGNQVLRFLERLTETAPIDSVTLERYLLLAQDVPGVTLRAVLEPSADEPGAMKLIAQVNRKATSGTISFDNRAFDQTGPVQGLAALDFNSFSEFGERTELSFYHTFPDSQNFGQVSSEFFLGGSGLKMKLYGGYGVVNPTGSLGATGYHGTTTVFGTQVAYPLIRSRKQTLSVYGGLDALESAIDTGTPSTRASFDSLRVLRVGGDYVLSDLWLGGDRSALNTVSARLSQGLQILGASTTGTAATSPRQHERTDFTRFNFEISRTQTLFAPWDGATVALMGLLAGQWSNDILPPAEQFYLGGSRFTRGYYAGQVPGDKALAATAELQLNTAFNLPVFRTDADVSTQFYLFYDWGETWQNQPADLAVKVSSAGGGARMQITRYAELDLEALGRFNLFPTGGKNQGISGLTNVGLYWRVLGRF